jgi:NADPH2:quinone reductase
VPGLEVAGTVAGLGEGVSGLRVGQRVIGFVDGGSYGQLATASAALTVPVPENLEWDQAGGFPIIALTAYHLLTTAGHIAKGDTVLVHAAAGGVGTCLLQLARILGASKVIGTAGGPEKVKHALEFGADDVIDYRAGDFGERVKELTGGKGPDIVLDAVGGDVGTRCLEILATFGRLVMYGNASAEKEMHISTNELRERVLSAVGFSLNGLRRNRPDVMRESAATIIGYLTSGKMRIDVSRIFPLADAAEAHRHIESRASMGKLLLDAS